MRATHWRRCSSTGIAAAPLVDLLRDLVRGEARREGLRVRLDHAEFTSLLDVLRNTAKAAQHHGAIRSSLGKVGRTVGVNDLHIPAHARSEWLTLVTKNLGEFERVPGLLTENWVVGPR